MYNFSALISLYAKEKPEHLHDSLNSIFNQSLLPTEVILVLDGPIDFKLQAVLDKFKSKYSILEVISLSKNVGLGKALNEGLKHCKYELVARMDTDDICFPQRFEKQVNFMKNNPEIDICSAWVEEFEENITNVRTIKKLPETHTEISEYIKKRNPLNHPAVMFRKSAVLNAGGYLHFPLFEDYYLWVRMFANGSKFANIQEPLLHFRISPDMFKRRGGLKYACDSSKFQMELHRLGLISLAQVIKASIIRGVVYIMPNSIRAFIYSRFLRG